MPGNDFDLDPVDSLAAGAVGEPGQRVFFMQAARGDELATLVLEKVQLRAVAERLGEVLEGLGDPVAAPNSELIEVEPDWRVAQLGVAYDSHRGLVLLMAQEGVPGEDEGSSARFWATPAQTAAFQRQALEVCSQGRPACPLCGLPMDSRGHVCPKKNGSRPVM
ncbi:MAG: DUF3090 family protein [Candidatus Dormibacteria bacterium]